MDELDDKFKIRIKRQAPYGSNGELVVEAPLPDDFGYTVGSVFSTPFDTMSLNETVAKGFALAGVTQKPGAAMKKMFIHPEPTEISFDVEFVAYYSARKEVVAPVLKLSAMALSSHMDTDDGVDQINGALAKLNAIAVDAGLRDDDDEKPKITVSSDFSSYGNKLLSILNFVRGPDKVDVYFGDLYTVYDVYLSSVAVRYSNKVDGEGFPLRAVATVTLTLENVPTLESVTGDWYGANL